MKTLESLIKTYNDFPKKGVAFKDVLGIIQDTEAFRELIFKMSSHQLIRDSGGHNFNRGKRFYFWLGNFVSGIETNDSC